MRRSSSREDPASAGGWWRGAGIATALGGRAAAKPSPQTPRGREGAAARQATASASRSPSQASPRQATASTDPRRFSRTASGGGGPQQPAGKEDQLFSPRPKARGRPADVDVSSPAASPLVSPSASVPSSPPTSPRGPPRAPVKVSVAAAKVAAQAAKDPAVAPSVKAEAPAAKAPAAKAAAPAAKTAATTAKAPAKAGGAPAVKAAPASAVKAEPAPTVKAAPAPAVKAAPAPAVKAASVTVVKVGPMAAAKALPAASAKAPVGAPEVKAAAPAVKAVTASKAPAAKAPAAKAAQAPAAAAKEDGPSASRASTQGRTGLAGSFFAAVGLTSSRAAASGAAASLTAGAGTASAVADVPPATSTSVPLVAPPQEVLSAMPARAEPAEENPPSPSASSTARAGLTGSLLAAVRLSSASTASPPAPSAPAVISVVRPVGGREDSVDKGQLKKTSKAKEAEDTNSLQSASTKSDEADATSLPSSASTPSSSETPSSASSDFKEGTRKYRLKHEIYIPKYQPEDILWQNEGQLVKFHHEVALPLLKATTPVPTGWLKGQFRLTLQRATPYQPFGITFLASDRSRFVIAEDLPHLGLEKGDELVTINKASPSSIHDVRKILKHSMTSELTIWRQQVQETGEVKQRPFTCCAAGQPQPAEDGSGKPRPVAEVKNKLLLAMLRPQVINEDKGEFRLVMQRFSLSQQFGLEFVSEPSKRKPAPMVVLPADFPHLGLRKGDRLTSINGVEPRTLVHCQHIYDNSLNLTLIFRRNPRGLVHLSALVERIEEEPGAAAAFAPVVEEVAVPERGWFGGTLHCGAWGSACQGAAGRSLPTFSKPTSPLAGPR